MPNRELYNFYRKLLRNWLTDTAEGQEQQLLDALTSGDIPTFQARFRDVVLRTLSYHDVGEDKSEAFYHAFVLGMMVHLGEAYEVRSNRESGYGRYDVMVIPRDTSHKGIIIEFKKADRYEAESLDEAVASALQQIETKQYESELRAQGITDIVKLGIAFKGKQVKVQEG